MQPPINDFLTCPALRGVLNGNISAISELVQELDTFSNEHKKLGEELLNVIQTIPTDEIEELVLNLCSLLCMNIKAKEEVCRRLDELGQDFKKVWEALRSNSLYSLMDALTIVDVELYDYDVKLIIGFLVHYPYAHIAHFPQHEASLLFSLTTSLQNVLESGECDDAVSNHVVVFSVDQTSFTKRKLAEMLFECLVNK
jgi:hypothetical protein